jgi:hypothetical protein
MFKESGQIDRIKMCEDCRVSDQFEHGKDPFKLGARPMVRTTEDDLRERELELARGMANGAAKPDPDSGSQEH